MSKFAFKAVLGTAVLVAVSLLSPTSIHQAQARAASSETEALLDPYDGGIQWSYGPRRRRGGHGDGGADWYDPPCAEVVIVDGSGAKHHGVKTFASLARALKCVPKYNPLTILVADGSAPINFPRRHYMYRAPEVSGRVVVKPLGRSYTLVAPPSTECLYFTGGDMTVEGATWIPAGRDRRAVPCIVATGGRMTFVRNTFKWRGGTAIIAGPRSIVTLALSTVTSDGVGVFVDRGRFYSIGNEITAASHLSSPDALGGWSNNPAITVKSGSFSGTATDLVGDIGLAILGQSRVRLSSCLDSRRPALCPDQSVSITGNSTGILLHRASGVTVEDALLEAKEGGTVVRSTGSTATVRTSELEGGHIGLSLANGGDFQLLDSTVFRQTGYGLFFGPGAAGRISGTQVFYRKPAKCFGPDDRRSRSHSGVDFDDDDCEKDRARVTSDYFSDDDHRSGSARSTRSRYDEDEDSTDRGHGRRTNGTDRPTSTDSNGAISGEDRYENYRKGEGQDDEGAAYAPPSDDTWYGSASDYTAPDEREYIPEDAGYRPDPKEE